MRMSRDMRLLTLLAIDSVVFLLEIVVGHAVRSLALVADSFHMLSDIVSLLVAFCALRLSSDPSPSADPRFSYGWQRAQVLGALCNGVFLLALCFSILMEAIQRVFHVEEVQSPRLVVSVGTLGLLSNFGGLVLFHSHSHARGHGHSHRAHTHDHHHAPDRLVHTHSPPPGKLTDSGRTTPLPGTSVGKSSSHSSTATSICDAGKDTARTSRSNSPERDSLYGPGQAWSHVVRIADQLRHSAGPQPRGNVQHEPTERDLLLPGTVADVEAAAVHYGCAAHSPPAHSHTEHGGEHEGGMNMRGVFLHVLGDALGNVGVIASGLFILLSDKWWRFYTDPAISFVLTLTICHSALPLVKSASFILLQGVPASVQMDQVHRALSRIPGVLNVHDLHIWQLSESKSVASVHLLVDSASAAPKAKQGGEWYDTVAARAKQVLHQAGIHSSTIQPEFVHGIADAAEIGGIAVQPGVLDPDGRLVTPQGQPVKDAICSRDFGCLLACNQPTGGPCHKQTCCPLRPLNRSSSAPHVVSRPATR